jgi:hypothetical protein
MTRTSTATHWSWEVAVDGVPKESGGKPTIEAALADAITAATYFMAQYPGQPIVITGIQQVCGACWNQGTVPGRKLYQRKKCPTCKGRCPAGQLGAIPVRLSEGNGGRGYRIVEAA